MLEGIGGPLGAGSLRLGLDPIDAALPGGGLPLACLHEIAGGGAGAEAGAEAGPDAGADTGPAIGFAAMVLGRLATGQAGQIDQIGPANRSGRAAQAAGHVVWIAADDPPYPPGLAAFGLPPERLVVASAHRLADRLWALEEAARSGAPVAVLGEVERLDLTTGRRLQLAAEAGGVTLLILNRFASHRFASGQAEPAQGRRGEAAGGVAVTRWQVASAPGRLDRLSNGEIEPGVGTPQWRLSLQRSRGGRPGDWQVAWGGPGTGLILVDPGIGAAVEVAAPPVQTLTAPTVATPSPANAA